MNHNHVVELYFKDTNRKILISDYDKIRYKQVKYVQPPAILYFGTLSGLISRMQASGIHSSTKGYIKLYDSKETAADFARKFISKPGDKVSVLEINTGAAFSDGLRFSVYKPGEFIVVKIESKYLTGNIL